MVIADSSTLLCIMIHSYMGRSVVDLPASVIHGFLATNESAHHFDRFVVVSWFTCVGVGSHVVYYL